jgi:WD40 repeat protein
MLRFAFQPRHPITQVAFTADGSEIVTAQPFTGIAVRDRQTGESRANLPLEGTNAILSIRVHPELGWVIARTSRAILVLDDANQRVILPTRTADGKTSHFGPIPAMNVVGLRTYRAMTADGAHAVAVTSAGPVIRDVDSGLAFARVNSPLRERHVARGRAVVAFSPDGSKLALGDGETLGVFDLSALPQTPRVGGGPLPGVHPLLTLERPDPSAHGTFADKQAEHWLPPVAFDHAGGTLFTLGLRNRVQRIDLATGGVLNEWGWRCEPIRSLAVSPDGLTAAAGCQRGELVLWDLE